MLGALLTAYLPGFAVVEIVWRPGGRGVVGFQFVPAHHFTFRDSLHAPRLVTHAAPQGEPLPADKFLVHRYRHRPGDVARGGLIRPLAWLYAFKNLNLKDLLRYLEKYGMPFIAARLEDHAFEQERRKIAWLIRNFGSDGGGVFTKATELQVLPQPTGGGELYFRFLDYAERAINKLLLGQTSSSDSRDSNRSTAAVHNLVRHDLLVDDCRALAETIRQHLLRPLVAWNFGAETPVPHLVFRAEAPADREAEARIIEHLARAGYRIAPGEITARFGYALAPSGAAPATSAAAAGKE